MNNELNLLSEYDINKDIIYMLYQILDNLQQLYKQKEKYENTGYKDSLRYDMCINKIKVYSDIHDKYVAKLKLRKVI